MVLPLSVTFVPASLLRAIPSMKTCEAYDQSGGDSGDAENNAGSVSPPYGFADVIMGLGQSHSSTIAMSTYRLVMYRAIVTTESGITFSRAHDLLVGPPVSTGRPAG
jgi:hypothetical protein